MRDHRHMLCLFCFIILYHHFFHRTFMVLFNDKLVKIAIEMQFLQVSTAVFTLRSTAVFTLCWFNIIRRMRNCSWNKIINICQNSDTQACLNVIQLTYILQFEHENRRIVPYKELTFFLVQNVSQWISNKRTQRALGRSPEEKVKGHSGAIYRGTLMLSTKYWQKTSR